MAKFISVETLVSGKPVVAFINIDLITDVVPSEDPRYKTTIAFSRDQQLRVIEDMKGLREKLGMSNK